MSVLSSLVYACTDAPANVRPNAFTEVLKPMRTHAESESLQVELHCRLTKACQQYTVLLNNMRLMAIFDWLLAVRDFVMTTQQEPAKDGQ